VFTFALAAAVLGVIHRRDRAGGVIAVAGVAGVAAFLVDVYLY
jgi:hypothetical protein